MRYISTRGEAPVLGFSDALLAGLARDGGLYLPESWPQIDAATIAGFAGKPYWQVAERVIAPFLGEEIAPKDLRAMLQEAYAAFAHPAVTPLVQLDDNLFVQELFHGPTLAFKDVAMQLLGRLMDHVLKARGRRATIVGATSGDTGSAAIEAFRGLDQVDIVILYPHGRVSDVQRRQMTTVAAPNVHAVALEGNFDDCQALVKAMFNHHAFRDELGLSGVNSINWARIVAQVVYYFTAAVALGAPRRPVSFAVPTGNFGDIFAGYVAKRMGLPIERLVIATNVNDILARTLETGAYEARGVVATSAPSMDIQVSSNFERLLFDAHGRDPAALRGLMASLSQSGRFEIDAATLAAIRAEFDGARADEAEIAATIGRTWREAGYLLDPHTAIGVAAAGKTARDPAVPTVVLGTAHPAKFPDAVERASGVRPALPAHLADLLERPERFAVLANDLKAVEDFVRARSRSARGAAA
ncbi:threonine synthase [Labrys wisconsinensis]|uniref:Threonine synthase n=1 Tax=Labrys wisconsinensis TaxID=425677 RepID=A0ABU0J9U7_9HYPH|nr:threonine synthase [Labrys wisconsinensis]MDQ0470400.1 threonine synthase [Labrys wisconsinensis]